MIMGKCGFPGGLVALSDWDRSLVADWRNVPD